MFCEIDGRVPEVHVQFVGAVRGDGAGAVLRDCRPSASVRAHFVETDDRVQAGGLFGCIVRGAVGGAGGCAGWRW